MLASLLLIFFVGNVDCASAQQSCNRTLTANDVVSKASRLLDFSHGKYERIEEDAFTYNAEAANRLDLSHNCLSDVPDNVFNNMPNLFEVDLSHNDVMHFPHAFQGLNRLNKLLSLKLNNNNINYLGREDLKGKTSIERIDCSCNMIEIINDVALDHLASLKSVTFSENRLTALPKFNLTELKKLGHMDFSNNSLQSLNIQHLTNFPEVTNMAITDERMTLSLGTGRTVEILIGGNSGTISCKGNLQDIRNKININYTLFCQDHHAHPHQVEGFSTSQSDPTTTEMLDTFSMPTPTLITNTNIEHCPSAWCLIVLCICIVSLVVLGTILVFWCRGCVVIKIKSPLKTQSEKERDQTPKVEKNGLIPISDL